MTKRLHEVPFIYTISGTRLVVAEDDREAKETADNSLVYCEDESLVADSGILWDEDDHIILKDGLRCSVQVGQATPFIGKPEEVEDLTPEDRAELGLPVLGDPDEGDTPLDSSGKPFDEDRSGSDKPGDDRTSGLGVPRPQPTPPAQPNRTIGMTSTADLNPPASTPPRPGTAPQAQPARVGSSPQPSTPPNPGQPKK